MLSPADALELPFVRTAVAELLLLALAGGTLGAWIVLRRLSFFTHSVGAAALPALVLAGPAGVSAPAAGIAAGLGFTAAVERASRSGRELAAATGLVLVACVGAGVVLASDVVESGSSLEALLFGSVLALGEGDLIVSAAAAVLAVAGTLLLGFAWLTAGFAEESSATLAFPRRRADAVLLGLVAVAAVAAIPAVGALLVTALFIVPAATARLATSTVRGLVLLSVALAAIEGLAGLYIAFALDAPPGPAIAALGAALYALVAVAERLLRRAGPAGAVAVQGRTQGARRP